MLWIGLLVAIPAVVTLVLIVWLPKYRVDVPRQNGSVFEPWILEVLTKENYSEEGRRLLLCLQIALVLLVVAVLIAIPLATRV